MEADSKFTQACKLFDAANERDPNKLTFEGQEYPQELLYSQWLTEWVKTLRPDASEALMLAARCQHIRRWEIPRDSYPIGKVGYLKWREGLKHFHAEKAAEVLQEAGYDEDTIQRVQSLNLKKNIKSDPECQTLEDALCLVFLQYQFDALIEKTSDEKMVSILQKTWKKMSESGHKAALALDYSESGKALIEKALQA